VERGGIRPSRRKAAAAATATAALAMEGGGAGREGREGRGTSVAREGYGLDIGHVISVAHRDKCATENIISVAHRGQCATEYVISVAHQVQCAVEKVKPMVGRDRMWAPPSFCGAGFFGAPQN
jgi:hypothetical protein